MKKLLFFILCFGWFAARSQVLYERTPKTVIPTDRNLFSTFNFKMPVYSDTAHANGMMFKDSIGLQFYNLFDSAVYVRSLGLGPLRRWLKQGTGGGGGAVSSVFTRAGAVVALTGDYAAFYPILAGAYADPTWITSLAATKIAGGQTVTPGSSKISLGGSPGGSVLQPFNIDVVPANVLLPTLGGLLTISQINATGSPSNTTFLRGDGTWSSPGSTVTGLPNTWVGAGYRLTFNFTNNVRTLFSNSYIKLDSTANANGITIFNDTSQIATKTDILKYSALNLDTVLSRGGQISANRTSDFNSKTWKLTNIKSFTVDAFTGNNNTGIFGAFMAGTNNYDNGGQGNIIGGSTDSVFGGGFNLIAGFSNSIIGGGSGFNIVGGSSNKVSNSNNIVGGSSNVISTNTSFIWGIADTIDNTATSSFVGGFNSHAKQSYSFISGNNLKTNRVGQSAFGQFNDTTGHFYLLMVGAGTADNTRRNAMAVDTFGFIYGKGVVSPTAFQFLMPTDGLNDTLATRNFVRGLVGTGGGGSGTNPFADNTPLVKNNAVNSKTITLDAGSISPATNRTYTGPDANGTLDLTSNTATLTNKSISATTNTISNLADANLNGSAAIRNVNLNAMPAHTTKLNNTAGSATPIDATQAQLTAEINVFTSTLQGVVPASGGGILNFLRADGGWFKAYQPADTLTTLVTKSQLLNAKDTLIIGHPGTSPIWGGYPNPTFDTLKLKSFDPTQFSTLSDSTVHFIGGGSGFTRQTHVSGTTVTISGNNYILTINPASTLATVTVTMPAGATDMSVIKIEFGGTLTVGMIVTSLTISPNSGQTIIDNTPPASATADDYLEYQYRLASNQWYRRKP